MWEGLLTGIGLLSSRVSFFIVDMCVCVCVWVSSPDTGVWSSCRCERLLVLSALRVQRGDTRRLRHPLALGLLAVRLYRDVSGVCHSRTVRTGATDHWLGE
jgi:hypothetical protein